MRGTERGLSTWAWFLPVALAGVPACGGQSTGSPSRADAANSGAGADAVGAAGAAGSNASSGAACTWPAAFDAPDVGSGQCTAARTYVSCVGSNGVTEDCLSDNALACPASDSDVNVPNPVCTSRCQAGEYALVCGGIGPESPTSEPPPSCRAALQTPAGVAFYCCPCGTGGGGECAPLSAVTSQVKLVENEIVAAGRDAHGTLYVLTEHSSAMRLFVSNVGALAEQFATGTGEGTDGAVQFWSFQYVDQQTVTVEVQKDESGTRMGVATGAVSGKGFDVGSQGSVLTLSDPGEAAAMYALTTHTFQVEYAGAAADGTNIVVVVQEHPYSYDTLRVFVGPVAALKEQIVGDVTRGLSIPSTTHVQLTVNGAPAQLSYASDGATLSIGTSSESFTGPAVPAAPPGADFICR